MSVICVWCVCLPGVLVFSERWRQRLACILWEAEFVLFEKERQRQRQILYSLKGGGRGVRVYYIFERQKQVFFLRGRGRYGMNG